MKNHKTLTFRAAKSLVATNRWLITGTPIMDATEEIFSYFKILQLPFTGGIRTFRTNYCNPDDADHPLRLSQNLRPYIKRRTYEDRLFGAPILDLPLAGQCELLCEQSEFERAVHIAIVEYYTKKIRSVAKGLRKAALVIRYVVSVRSFRLNANKHRMINKLRQLNIHPMLVQSSFRLFDEETLDKLVTIYDKTMIRNVRKDFVKLQQLLKLRPTQKHGDNYGTYPSFEKYQRALEGMKAQVPGSTLECNGCREKGFITSQLLPCTHVYCTPCTEDMRIGVNGRGSCIKCKTLIDEYLTRGDGRFDAGKDVDSEAEDTTSANQPYSMTPDCDWLRLKGLPMPSSKLCAAKVKILAWRSQDPSTKVIIFTHWKKL